MNFSIFYDFLKYLSYFGTIYVQNNGFCMRKRLGFKHTFKINIIISNFCFRDFIIQQIQGSLGDKESKSNYF